MNRNRILLVKFTGKAHIVWQVKIDAAFVNPDEFVDRIAVKMHGELPVCSISAKSNMMVAVFITFTNQLQEVPEQDIIPDGIRFQDEKAFLRPFPGSLERK